MNEYNASNGVRIEVNGGYLRAVRAEREAGATADMMHATAGPDGIAALREFFQHKRDEELGRWRWPENPDYVVYPVASEHAVVWDERRREAWYVHLDIDQAESVRTARDAFRAYLAAHSEPKPWHDAKPGEVWALSVEGEEIACIVTPCGPDFEPVAHPVWATLARGSDRITSGRRIWPVEGVS